MSCSSSSFLTFVETDLEYACLLLSPLPSPPPHCTTCARKQDRQVLFQCRPCASASLLVYGCENAVLYQLRCVKEISYTIVEREIITLGILL